MTPAQPAVRGHRSDLILALAIFALLGVGMIMMYSISPVVSTNYSYFFDQFRYAILGVIVWLVVARVNYHFWKRWATWFLVIAGFTVGLLIPFGRSSLGATRWVQLGPVTFQPAEILKAALIVYLAVWFESHREHLDSFWEGVVPFLLMVGAACGVIVVFQRDLGTATVLALASIGMYVLAGLTKRNAIILGAICAVALVMAIAIAPHRISRLTTFLDPGKDPTGQGYQVNQALIAVGSGGVLGLGLGQSVQVHGYLPEATTDSIFAIIAEEAGLFGSIAVMVCYGVLVYRGLEIARLAPDSFGRLTAAGISLWFCFQTLINIGAMLSVVPLTGIPLPYISYGGTNLVVSFIGAGILLNISKYTTSEEGYAYSGQRRRNSWTRVASGSHNSSAQLAE